MLYYNTIHSRTGINRNILSELCRIYSFKYCGGLDELDVIKLNKTSLITHHEGKDLQTAPHYATEKTGFLSRDLDHHILFFSHNSQSAKLKNKPLTEATPLQSKMPLDDQMATPLLLEKKSQVVTHEHTKQIYIQTNNFIVYHLSLEYFLQKNPELKNTEETEYRSQYTLLNSHQSEENKEWAQRISNLITKDYLYFKE